MDNELDLNLDNIEGQTEEKLKVKNRFEKLSEKVIITSKEKEAEVLARQKVEAERDSLSKERDFYKDFSVNVGRYPEASAYQDKILEKVKGGYSTEDAMVSVLAKEGKLNNATPPAPTQKPPQAEGGSAQTTFAGNKTLEEMTPAEKLAALGEADARGELVNALRGR